MAAPTYSAFATRFGAWASDLLTEDTEAQAAISTRLSFHWTQHSAWSSERRTEAALLLVAHERQQSLDRASRARMAGQQVRSKSAGSWSRQLGAAATSGPDGGIYGQTDWGQQYLVLRSQVRRRPLTGGMPRG